MAKAKQKLLLLLGSASSPVAEYVAMTLGWMCAEAGVVFDTYYAADHGHGGLFAKHGSPVISGQHGARVARALATFDATIVRLDGLCLFDSLLRASGVPLIDAGDDLRSLYLQIAAHLGIAAPIRTLSIDNSPTLPPGVFYPECAARRAMATPDGASAERLDFDGDDPALACVKRYAAASAGIDLYEPLLVRYMLAFSQRSNRLVLPYTSREEAVVRRDQMLSLRPAHADPVAYGRWFGDPQLQPLAKVPMGCQVIEPHRNVLTCFAPAALPQPSASWTDLEPDDDQLREWAAQKKILASWVLHSGELSHDDSVLAFLDWSTMTKVKIGAGVHWQRYHSDPDVVEPLHVPVSEGGVLGLVEPVLHSAGNGIIWETAGDPVRIAALMRRSRDRIAQVAGERFAPRGVYCFSDVLGQDDAQQVSPAQQAVWKAIHDAGFEYVISATMYGDSRVLYRDGDFVVLSQAGRWDRSSPFVRGTPQTFARYEEQRVRDDKPGWMVGAIDTPIHGSQIYIGRPYVDGEPQPRINDFYDYTERGGSSGRVVSATPRTIARYARLIEGAR